jgi:hypothetical protein
VNEICYKLVSQIGIPVLFINLYCIKNDYSPSKMGVGADYKWQGGKEFSRKFTTP